MLRASCLTLEINEFRGYEAKIEESEKTSSHRESNPGHLWLFFTFLYFCLIASKFMAWGKMLWATQHGFFPDGDSTTCAVHIEDYEGWWYSGCCGSVAEHWRLKPKVSWVRLPATAGFFTFLYFHLITFIGQVYFSIMLVDDDIVLCHKLVSHTHLTTTEKKKQYTHMEAFDVLCIALMFTGSFCFDFYCDILYMKAERRLILQLCTSPHADILTSPVFTTWGCRTSSTWLWLVV